MNAINKELNKDDKYPQANLLNRPENQMIFQISKTSKDRNLPFIIPFDARSIKVHYIIKKHWSFIYVDTELNELWKHSPTTDLKDIKI